MTKNLSHDLLLCGSFSLISFFHQHPLQSLCPQWLLSPFTLPSFGSGTRPAPFPRVNILQPLRAYKPPLSGLTLTLPLVL